MNRGVHVHHGLHHFGCHRGRRRIVEVSVHEAAKLGLCRCALKVMLEATGKSVCQCPG